MLKNYVKIALKVFWRHKFFTGVNLFGICLTLIVLIMATVAFDQEVGPIPPEVHTDRTLHLSWIYVQQTWAPTDASGSRRKAWGHSLGASYAFLDRYVRPLESAEKVTVFSRFSDYRGFRGGAEETYVSVKMTDAAFWEVFRFNFRQGRSYSTEEVEAGDFVAVINAGFSKRFFGSEAVVGKSVPIDGQNYRVVGVVADPFGERTRADVWVPATTAPPEEWRTYKLDGGFRAAVLARRPADMARIRAEFATVLEQVEPPPDERIALIRVSAPLVTTWEEWMLNVGGGLWIKDYAESGGGQQFVPLRLWRQMLIVGGFILLAMLLPALHLVNLNISRIEERTSEIGVRKSFGASARTLVGQFVVENVLLTLVGGALSLPCSWGIAVLLDAYIDVGVLLRTFAYGVLLAVFFGVVSGAYPAWRMAHLHPVQALTGREK